MEQALFKKQDKPYRVRIYKVSQRGENEKEWIGKWATPEAFDALTESNIELKPGCEVVLQRLGNTNYVLKIV